MELAVIKAAAAATLAAGALAFSAPALAVGSATVDFSSGSAGWEGPQGMGGWSGIIDEPWLGERRPSYYTQFSNFGITFSNTSNPAFVGDYTSSPSVTISLDVFAREVFFFSMQVTRDLVVELRDYDNTADGYPYVSVWFNLGTLDPSVQAWQSWSVTIADTSATTLPAGWGGYGAEDPVTYEPTLPAGRTFADVLAGMDEIVFTTYVPGMFYGETYFEVALDNITISAVPEPATALMALVGVAALAGLGARRRALQRG